MSDDDLEPAGKTVRVGHLRTIGAVASELGRVYRAARHGKISSIEAYRLAAVLTALRACLEASDIERRLEELETLNSKALPMLTYKGGLQ